MTPSDFILHIVMIFSIFIVRGKIAAIINDKLQLPFEFKSQWVSYLLTVWLVMVIVFGMLYNESTPFGEVSVSGSIENLEPAQNKQPHRFFDVNFNIFNF